MHEGTEDIAKTSLVIKAQVVIVQQATASRGWGAIYGGTYAYFRPFTTVDTVSSFPAAFSTVPGTC